MNLGSKVVLITGASSGIGRACAIAFAEEGSFLAITGRRSEALEETKNKCCQSGAHEKNVLIVVGELAEDKVCERIVDSVIQHFGRIDVLVNNAGCGTLETSENVSMESYDRTMNVNLRSPYLLMKLCLPHLEKTKGNIVNMSSIAGLKPIAEFTSYCVSKAGLDMLTRCISLEVASKGVRVNSVNPGEIDTKMYKSCGITDEAYKTLLEFCKTNYPLRRAGEVQDVTAAVLFLASDKASFITGITLPVDGGFTNCCPR